MSTTDKIKTAPQSIFLNRIEMDEKVSVHKYRQEMTAQWVQNLSDNPEPVEDVENFDERFRNELKSTLRYPSARQLANHTGSPMKIAQLYKGNKFFSSKRDIDEQPSTSKYAAKQLTANAALTKAQQLLMEATNKTAATTSKSQQQAQLSTAQGRSTQFSFKTNVQQSNAMNKAQREQDKATTAPKASFIKTSENVFLPKPCLKAIQAASALQNSSKYATVPQKPLSSKCAPFPTKQSNTNNTKDTKDTKTSLKGTAATNNAQIVPEPVIKRKTSLLVDTFKDMHLMRRTQLFKQKLLESNMSAAKKSLLESKTCKDKQSSSSSQDDETPAASNAVKPEVMSKSMRFNKKFHSLVNEFPVKKSNQQDTKLSKRNAQMKEDQTNTEKLKSIRSSFNLQSIHSLAKEEQPGTHRKPVFNIKPCKLTSAIPSLETKEGEPSINATADADISNKRKVEQLPGNNDLLNVIQVPKSELQGKQINKKRAENAVDTSKVCPEKNGAKLDAVEKCAVDEPTLHAELSQCSAITAIKVELPKQQNKLNATKNQEVHNEPAEISLVNKYTPKRRAARVPKQKANKDDNTDSNVAKSVNDKQLPATSQKDPQSTKVIYIM